MLKAMVMVCSLAMPDSCFELEDTRGPYLTKEQCFIRVGEIIEGIKPVLPDQNVQFYWKCTRVGSGETT